MLTPIGVDSSTPDPTHSGSIACAKILHFRLGQSHIFVKISENYSKKVAFLPHDCGPYD